MKIIYKDPQSKQDKLKVKVMKIMSMDLIRGVEVEELFPAENSEGEDGLYISTKLGGKKFWTNVELETLFIKKNKEERRLG